MYNKEETTKLEYNLRIKKLSTTLNVCDDVEIFSDHLRSLRSLVEKMLSLSQGEDSIDDIRIELRKDINKTEQQRNSKRYKRESKPRRNHEYD